MKHEMISMQRELQEAKDAVKKLEQEKNPKNIERFAWRQS